MKNCETCEFWTTTAELQKRYGYHEPEAVESDVGKYRVCKRIVLNDHIGSRKRLPLAYTQDASGYRADLWTRPEFSCIEWSKK